MSEMPWKPIVYLFVLLPIHVGGALLVIWALIEGYAQLKHIRTADIQNSRCLEAPGVAVGHAALRW